ncbi:MAG: acetylxylan esterase [Saprospiraceae bacterium]
MSDDQHIWKLSIGHNWKYCICLAFLIGIVPVCQGQINAKAVESKWVENTTISVQFHDDYPVFAAGAPLVFQCKFVSKSSQPIAGLLHCAIQQFSGENFISKSQKIYIDHYGKVDKTIQFAAVSQGFYRVYLRLTDDTGQQISQTYGFAVAPEQVIGKGNVPEDFDAFWSLTLDKLKQVPLNFTRTKNASLSKENIEVYDVSIQSYDGRYIKGFYALPKGKNRLPAILRFPDFVGAGTPDFLQYPKCAQFFLLPETPIDGSDNARKKVPASVSKGIASKEKYIYRGIYMDGIRCLDFLCAQAEVDTSHIAVMGHGQGGALCISTAALDPRIKLCLPDAISLADIQDRVLLNAWPTQSVEVLLNQEQFSTERLFETLSYFDPQSFAPKVNCPILLGMGMLDADCPPLTQFAVFNKIQSVSKAYLLYPAPGSAWTGVQAMRRGEWLETYFFAKK